MTDLSLKSAYHYELPEALIAQRPVEPRDASRLLVLDRASGRVEHRMFRDFPGLLREGDLLVANNSRVIRARLKGLRWNQGQPGGPGAPGGHVEFVLLEKIRHRRWEGLIKASAKAQEGFSFVVPTPDGKPTIGKIVRGMHESPSGTVEVEFTRDPVDVGAGELPLPPYVDRAPEASDEAAYQTVYAKEDGSAAAPTAGLHFTPEVIEATRARGAEWAEVTLHVGVGTFRPVKAERIADHVMHEERFTISERTAEQVEKARAQGRRILAIGTTSVRTLESAWDGHQLRRGDQRTSLFLHPGGREPRLISGLLTNFHLPSSTLLMLVCAFAGYDATMNAYREAVREKYRFFSYGDAMVVL